MGEGAGELARQIEVRLALRAEEKVSLYPRSTPIASDVDPDSCLRRQVLEIVRWQDRRPIPADRQGRLEAGRDAEEKALGLLRELGFRTVRGQELFELKHRRTREPLLRGKIDCFIEWEGEEVPTEVKSLVPHVYDRIQEPADLDRYWWTRRYIPQVTAYLVGFSRPTGILLLTNLIGDWRPMPIALDYDLGERVLAFAEAVVDAVRQYRQDESLPPYTEDPMLCTRCPFFGAVCNPPTLDNRADVEFIVDPGFELMIARREELRPGHRDYERLDKRIKRRLERGPLIRVVGEWMLSGRLVGGRGGAHRRWDVARTNRTP